MTQRIALYPGTFDPLTNGHADIIQRARKLCDKLVIGVAINREKEPLFSLDERVDMVTTAVKQMDGHTPVQVVPFEGLLMHFAQANKAQMIVRGLRAVSDFEYEFQMACMNDKLDPTIETVFLMADPQHQAIASRLVKQIARLGGDISHFVPPEVEFRLKDKFS
ncbi:pantetheine-phosphate adenylyltransferase [Robiginitomaculum antarcticum]|uniref:pantetheine-phosphate adenylyltransferase n=1 Tax=Robiginitomaculum antarcticum TaxID=437507 RepID=UPI00036147C9|nr:pantetheine-phosphate adenylyltransferase [Robiginitomaculum antarcticum]